MRFTHSEQIEMIKGIRLSEGETKRIDCPFCNGRKTFTITKRRGSKVWNCYKASCGVTGGTNEGRSVDEIRSVLDRPAAQPPEKKIRPLPALTSDPRRHQHVMNWLERNHCIEAMEAGRARIEYDPAEDRVLFFVRDGVGAVGRSLRNAKPKWLSYGDVTGRFFCGDSDVGVLVEDAASACAVSSLATGIAVLGSRVTSSIKPKLKTFNKLIIALDNDASSRAINESWRVNGFVETTVRFLDEDLKYLSTDQIKEALRL